MYENSDETERSKRQKIWIAALLLVIAWAVFIYLDAQAESFRELSARTWLQDIFSRTPWHSLADACLITLTTALVYEWWIRRENDRELKATLREMLHTDRAVTDMSASKTVSLLRATLQRLTVDKQFGSEIANFLDKRILDVEERRYGVRYNVTISNNNSESIDERIHFFNLTYDLLYEKIFREKRLYFICLDNLNDYNDSLSISQHLEFRWVTTRKRVFQNTFSDAFFSLDYFRINSENLKVQSREIGKDIMYYVDIPDSYINGERHHCEYRILLKTERFSHCLFVDVRVPCKGLTFPFDFAGTDVNYVNVFDAFTSAKRPYIKFMPANQNFHRVEVGLDDDWVIPKSGVSFTWNLRHQVKEEAKKAGGY